MKRMTLLVLVAGLLSQCRDSPGIKQDLPDTEQAAPQIDSALTRERARDLAIRTQATLGGTLRQQIAEKGVASAISFCHMEALPITDSLAALYGVGITRITDRPRNPLNRASPEEEKIMEGMRIAMAGSDGAPGPGPADSLGGTTYYFPIVTNDLCVNCHGKPEADIDPSALREIRRRYPSDSALGYGPGQLRGLWKVTAAKSDIP